MNLQSEGDQTHLFPGSLEASADDHIGLDADYLLLGHGVPCGVPLSPPELQREASKETGLGRAHLSKTSLGSS
jgi:hypothetical protein